MASGKVVGHYIRETPPGANAATVDVRSGGSTPSEELAIRDFDDGTDEYMDYLFVMRDYDAGGLTVNLKWMASTATSGNVVWQAALRRIADDAEDIDSSHTYAFNTVTAGAPSASGEVGYDSITFTDGADMDSVADGDLFILRVSRDADNASDTMTGDAELLAVEVLET
ncbi:MAG: hypothetical protein VXB01_02600 [Opitutae bacterium]